MSDLFQNMEHKEKHNIYVAPKFEVINFDYSDVIRVSVCSNDCVNDCPDHAECLFADDAYWN